MEKDRNRNSRRRFLKQILAGSALWGLGSSTSLSPGPELQLSSAFAATSGSPLPRNTTVLYQVNGVLVEQWPPVAASALQSHFGFNLGDAGDLNWVLDRAVDAGCKEIRAQPASWQDTEVLGSPGTYRNAGQTVINAIQARGMRVRLVGAYGPPWQAVADLVLYRPASPGDTCVYVNGNLSGFVLWRSFLGLGNGGSIRPADGNQYLGNWSYYGSLISSVDAANACVNLAAPLVRALPAGTPLVMNNLMYPFPLAADPNDPGIVAYCNYLRALARQMETSGASGSIDIWNEPPWQDDRWLTPRRYFSGQPPGWMTSATSDFAVYPALFDNLSASWPFTRIRLGNSAPNKTADGDWLFLRRGGTWEDLQNPPQSLLQTPQAQEFSESFHPYGAYPEQKCWYPTNAQSFPYNVVQGGEQGSNFRLAVYAENRFSNLYGYSLPITLTETGLSTGDDFVQALFLTRQFLAYESLGIEGVDIFCLDGQGQYGVLSSQTHTERLAMRVFHEMNFQIGSIATGTPSQPAGLPVVHAYDGRYPLAMIPILGAGRLFLVFFQRNYGGDWSLGPSPQGYVPPGPASVALSIPAGLRYDSFNDFFNRSPVEVQSVNAQQLNIRNLVDYPLFLKFIIQ